MYPLVQMYRLEDTIVILSELYPATINRRTMSCIIHTFLAKEKQIAVPMKLYSLHLHPVTSRSQRYTCYILLNNKKEEKEVTSYDVNLCASLLYCTQFIFNVCYFFFIHLVGVLYYRRSLKPLITKSRRCVSGTIQRINEANIHQIQLPNQKGEAMELHLCVGTAKVCTKAGSFGAEGFDVRSKEEERDSKDLSSTKRKGRKTIFPM
jgi:hypothetical protein